MNTKQSNQLRNWGLENQITDSKRNPCFLHGLGLHILKANNQPSKYLYGKR